MHHKKTRLLSRISVFPLIFLLLGLTGKSEIDRHPHHQLNVTLDIKKGSMAARDTLILSPHLIFNKKESSFSFLLREEMELSTPPQSILEKNQASRGWTVSIDEKNKAGATQAKRITIHKPVDQSWPQHLRLNLAYAGPIPDYSSGSNHAQGMPKTGTKPPVTQALGVLLSGSDLFYPQLQMGGEFADSDKLPALITFSLSVNVPERWHAVSQGERTEIKNKNGRRWVTWESDKPMEEIFLIADEFSEYKIKQGNKNYYAFLLNPEKALAEKYLQATGSYIDFFDQLLGPYPYTKFALVENSRQTGYGMPSFTLLGSRIIRFPFILRTSYPHEILHNWWGNGVYIDPRSGNWAEGLTAYLADHLMAELEGKGDRYRFQELVKYLNYVKTNTDFPLADFRSREDMASQAIGYGKTLMMFHMLRTELGDSTFLQGLRHFYQHRLFRFSGFEDIRISFEHVSGKNLGPFFRQWTTRKGAPELELALAVATVHDNKPSIMLEVRQTQPDPLFPLTLPVAVWTNKNVETKNTRPYIFQLRMDNKMQTFLKLIPGIPRAVRLDPYNEVFRKLDRRETPAGIGQTYGSDTISIVFPEKKIDANSPNTYNAFVKAVADNADAELIRAKGDFTPAPGRSYWILGRDHKAADLMRDQLKMKGVKFDQNGITLEGKYFLWSNHSFVFTVRHPADAGRSLTWVVADPPASIPGLIRKLPHYGKYGYLVFEGSEPTNRLKGLWPSIPTGLMKTFVPGTYTLPPQKPLVDFRPAGFTN